ncbi:helix-turn-helix domain-containing protein [Granulicatella seriolae]|jgi:excisionase family DNA binding protein|uniref:Helix-turn-helix domain-containing protein n=1 Tax=Granulicatella seriolae TaxID=2967226 RepID=A0ABT1WLY4_9LACT|nr:helix-turn-helix domain-containing protein [Granulicatella seriolae]
MYLSVEATADYLQVDQATILRLIREKQIRTVRIDDELLINDQQFKLFLEQREKELEAYQRYLEEPIPEDIDIKDED